MRKPRVKVEEVVLRPSASCMAQEAVDTNTCVSQKAVLYARPCPEIQQQELPSTLWFGAPKVGHPKSIPSPEECSSTRHRHGFIG